MQVQLAFEKHWGMHASAVHSPSSIGACYMVLSQDLKLGCML